MRTEYFSMKRFSLLLQRQKMLNLKTWLIAMISVAGFNMFIAFLTQMTSAVLDVGMKPFENFGIVAFVIMGLVFGSLAFSEMGTYAKSLQYVTLPASRFEKFFTAWLVTSVLYIIFAVVTLFATSLVMTLISMGLYDGSFIVFNPFTVSFGKAVIAFFIAHSFFFLGAVWFRKAAFFKTLLSLFVINIILNVWMTILFFLVINPFKLFAKMGQVVYNFDGMVVSEQLISWVVLGYFSILGMFMLFIAWVRFKEREV
jgi:ABC-type transport system involved in multi-copper enzyme maturation permease subunit